LNLWSSDRMPNSMVFRNNSISWEPQLYEPFLKISFEEVLATIYSHRDWLCLQLLVINAVFCDCFKIAGFPWLLHRNIPIVTMTYEGALACAKHSSATTIHISPSQPSKDLVKGCLKMKYFLFRANNAWNESFIENILAIVWILTSGSVRMVSSSSRDLRLTPLLPTFRGWLPCNTVPV